MLATLSANLYSAGGSLMFSLLSFRFFRTSVMIATLLAGSLAAQTGVGVVRGTVQDATKGVLPQAKATLTGTATGIERATITNTDGIYDFENVPVGPYKLAIEAVGFKK